MIEGGNQVKVETGRSIWHAIHAGEIELSHGGSMTIRVTGRSSVAVGLTTADHFSVFAEICDALKEAKEKTCKLDEELTRTLPLLKEAAIKSSPLSEAKVKEISQKRKVFSAVSGSSRARHTIHKGLN